MITIETIKAGQPRAYADSIYEYVITVNQVHGPVSDQEKYIRELAKAAYGRPENIADNRQQDQSGLHPYVSAIEQLSPTKWKVRIIQPFLD